MGDDFAAGVEFVHALGQITQRDKVSADVADLVFVRLANVQNEKVFALSSRRFSSST